VRDEVYYAEEQTGGRTEKQTDITKLKVVFAILRTHQKRRGKNRKTNNFRGTLVKKKVCFYLGHSVRKDLRNK